MTWLRRRLEDRTELRLLRDRVVQLESQCVAWSTRCRGLEQALRDERHAHGVTADEVDGLRKARDMDSKFLHCVYGEFPPQAIRRYVEES